MARSDKGHMDESLNLRSFYLRLLKKIWIIPVAAVVGAVIAAAIYTLVTVSFGPEKTYRSEARLYISFAYDEKKGSLVDWYNAYTWNNMLMPTDDLLNPILDELRAQGVDITGDEVLASVTAEIPSDVRIMLLSVENSDRELTDMISKAAIKSLENYGEINDAFDSIKLMGSTDAKLVVYSDKTLNATVLGAVILAIAAILIQYLLAALDDSVYTPEDAENRYGIKVLGTMIDKPLSADYGETENFFRNELVAAMIKALEGTKEISFISSDSLDDGTVSKKDSDLFKEMLGESLGDSTPKISPMAVPGTVLENYRKLGSSDGVILAIPYGKRNGTMNEHVIAQLRKHECPIIGLLLVRADKSFLKRYYRLK